MALSNGDTVHWNTSQGKTTGTLVRKRVSEFEFDGQTFKPTTTRTGSWSRRRRASVPPTRSRR